VDLLQQDAQAGRLGARVRVPLSWQGPLNTGSTYLASPPTLQKAMSIRISNKQRIVLEDIDAAEQHVYQGKKVPLYIEHITDEVQFSFNSERERARWLEAMEARSLIVIERGCFLRLADMGRDALKIGQKATRRDFQAEESARQKQAGIIQDDAAVPDGWPFE
jgi:hypothetical protein